MIVKIQFHFYSIPYYIRCGVYLYIFIWLMNIMAYKIIFLNSCIQKHIVITCILTVINYFIRLRFIVINYIINNLQKIIINTNFFFPFFRTNYEAVKNVEWKSKKNICQSAPKAFLAESYFTRQITRRYQVTKLPNRRFVVFRKIWRSCSKTRKINIYVKK